MADFTWTCPYCQKIATIIPENVSRDTHWFNNKNKDGALGLVTQVIVCPNGACKEYVVQANLFHASTQKYNGNPYVHGTPLLIAQLRPISTAKPFPEYVPAPIRQDYEEACSIMVLSPKASATLSRRCLQGMIRDFWGIKKATLFQEIEALRDKVDATTWQAIDAVRSIGNIGAHMEKEIDLIVEVDPAEAELLASLIEELIQEWYLRRFEKEERLKKVIATAQSKVTAKQGNAP